MPQSDPKVTGFKLPASIDAGSFVSVTLCIPNILEYKAAFNGQINMLGKWFQWAHTQADYQDIPELNREVAQQWTDILVNAVWEEGCMTFCERMIECLTNDTDVQQALADLIASNPAIRDALQNLINTGSIITNPTSPLLQTEDLDALFGACTYLIDTMNGANIDLYEALESSTNKRELGEILFEAIPILETLPLDEVSEYIDTLASSVAEGYVAQYTTTPITGMRDRLRCGLFCLARANDNTLTWDLIAEFFWSEVGFTSADYVDTMVDFVNFFLSGSWVGEEIVFISFANIASALSTSQIFAAMTFPSLATIMELGALEPSNAWETLCEDCPPDEWIQNDFTGGSMFNWEAIGPYADFSNGWTDGSADDTQIGIRNPFTGITITALRVYMNVDIGAASGGDARWLGNADLSSLQVMPTSDGIMFESLGLSRAAGIGINFSIGAGMTGKKIVAVWYKTT